MTSLHPWAWTPQIRRDFEDVVCAGLPPHATSGMARNYGHAVGKLMSHYAHLAGLPGLPVPARYER